MSLDAQTRGEPRFSSNIQRSDTSDIARLTRLMVSGDELAYRTFYHAYFGRLSRYLLVVCAGDEQAMREALQETLRRVVRHVRVFQDEAAFWSWLTVLARSARSDEGRKRRRYFAFLDRFKHHAAVAMDEGASPNLADDLEQLLELCLRRLPAEERTLLEAKYFESRSVIEIAERLGCTEKSVESRLVRIRKKLKTAILVELNHED